MYILVVKYIVIHFKKNNKLCLYIQYYNLKIICYNEKVLQTN